ncbi:MAG: hypothetical protein JWN22_901 [Nocardioides sp.]|jgi:hypothetical protein|nr:hypothetical protein [Nocardioides sp.]
MRSRLADVDPALAMERALGLGLCGVGGRLAEAPRDATDALARTEEEYDARTARRLERFQAVPEGATVWTRDEDGMFRRGVLTGRWRYDDAPQARAADLVHVRPCEWGRPLPEHETPAAVAATFRRGGRNFQRIRQLDAV